MNPLDYLNLCYIWCKSYPSLKRMWRFSAVGGVPRVSYGYDNVPDPTAHVFGGLVKLQDLNQAFPQRRDHPNLLYLVSSALPYFPLRLARMAKKSGAKLVVNQNGVAYPGWYGKGWQQFNRPMGKLLEMADYVFYQSNFCKISADLFLNVKSPIQGEILYNPVDTSFFYPVRDRKRDKIHLLLSGSHWAPYRVFTALDALREVRKTDKRTRLKIAGRFCWHKDPAQAEKDVISYAKSLGIEPFVVLSGPYKQEEAPDILRSCDILLHTKYNDPCPRLVVEAMSCGLPVVYSATGGVPEQVGGRAGIGVKGPLDWERDHPPDAKELAQGVLKVLDNLEEYSDAARQRAVSHFDVTPWLQRHGEVFQELLAEN
jgi:glycosyltransferase involved in cell wall biosynthesis